MFDKEKYDAVLWDLDDTLYSRIAAAHQVYVPMFQENLYPEHDTAFCQKAADTMITLIFPDSMIQQESFDALMAIYPPDIPYVRKACVEYYYDHMYQYAVPDEDAMGCVKALRRLGIKNAILTNCDVKRSDSQWRKIRKIGIAPYMDEILLTGEFGIHKPDKAPYLELAKRLGVRPERCLFVGDSASTDIPGARNAGMDAVWLNVWGLENTFDPSHVTAVRRLPEYFGAIL